MICSCSLSSRWCRRYLSHFTGFMGCMSSVINIVMTSPDLLLAEVQGSMFPGGPVS
jgi:hypothetical protein